MKLVITIISILFISFTAQAECEVSPKFSYKTKGLSVSFTNKTIGEFETVSWNFGDGATSTTLNPTHQYPTKGIYEFSLTVFTKEGCESSFTGKVYVFNTTKKVKTGPKKPIVKTNSTPAPVASKTVKNLGNYPNPFSTSTNIDFELTTASDVQVNVYSMSGKLVRNLANDSYTAGKHQLNFDRGDLPTGIYTVQITTGDYNYSHQLMIH